MIYTLRTTSGREDIVIDLLLSKISADSLDIKSVFHPAEIKGYVFIEGKLGNVHKAIQGLMHIRGLIEKPIRLEEIQHFLEPKMAKIKVDDSDIIEIIGGPFKGEKGKVTRINKIKDEITVELLEASIPIPVTIATEFVKIVKKAKPTKIEKPVQEEEREEEEGSVFDMAQKEAEKPEEPKEEEKPADEEKKEEPKKEEKKEEEKPPEEKKEDKLKSIMEEEKEKVKEEAKPVEDEKYDFVKEQEKGQEEEDDEESDLEKELKKLEKKKKKDEDEL
jgi:transcriptional antiterminator NusG